MSYCRIKEGESDVYIIMTRDGLECMHANWLNNSVPYKNSMTHAELVQHLTLHVKHGHKVPRRIWKRIHREMGLTT